MRNPKLAEIDAVQRCHKNTPNGTDIVQRCRSIYVVPLTVTKYMHLTRTIESHSIPARNIIINYSPL
jgi:hypothetical protein